MQLRPDSYEAALALTLASTYLLLRGECILIHTLYIRTNFAPFTKSLHCSLFKDIPLASLSFSKLATHVILIPRSHLVQGLPPSPFSFHLTLVHSFSQPVSICMIHMLEPLQNLLFPSTPIFSHTNSAPHFLVTPFIYPDHSFHNP